MIRVLAVICLLQVAAFGQHQHDSPCPKLLGNVNTFAAVYYDEQSLAELGKFDMVILDPANYTSAQIAILKSMGCMPIAYLNIGEVETYRSYFTLGDTNLFLSPDPYWRNRYYADVCSSAWQKIILKERIPDLLRKGYCGLFIDLSDLLQEYPQMSGCAVSLIGQIRREVAESNLILDGGVKIINRVGSEIDGVAVEGLMGFYDFNSDTYKIRPDSIEDHESTILLQAAKKFRIKIFQLDYAAPSDVSNRDGIIMQSRRLGFVPYVGTIELDTLFVNTVRQIRILNSEKKNPFPD
ncbi:MAG: endo alpha-1,4 polygalactosaminidase [Bacteroidetes bacterium]|nr:endo alpha-1,4 polygalactosaminidase [Bacteroidota bacterium]